MLKCIGMQNLIKVYHVVQELWAYDHDLQGLSSAKLCHRFAYQYLDNVKMYKYAKLDRNIWFGSRVMNILTKIPELAKTMLGSLVIILNTSRWAMLK